MNNNSSRRLTGCLAGVWVYIAFAVLVHLFTELVMLLS
jgi:hypothetical protein